MKLRQIVCDGTNLTLIKEKKDIIHQLIENLNVENYTITPTNEYILVNSESVRSLAEQ